MAAAATKSVNLALQGGGAHGAFTWGVLDRLLDEERLVIEGVTATSAGAMNAAALKTGLTQGGSRDAAQRTLADFWRAVSRQARGPVNPLLEWVRWVNPTTENLAGAMKAGAHVSAFAEATTRMFSPYHNPFDYNPLRRILEDQLDFDAVCAADPPHLFICATNVRTGKARVFRGEEISTDAILASACLPTLYRAVEIDDPRTGRREAYWDGGYTGNPALFPLFYETTCRDILIVHINPLERDEVPRTPQEIQNRVNEISFNSALLHELRAIAFVSRMIHEGRVPRTAFKDVLIHSIMDDETMSHLSVATKARADWTLLQNLRDAGRAAADRFLRASWGNLGERASVDLRALYG